MAKLKPAPVTPERYDNAGKPQGRVLVPKGIYRVRVVEMTDEQPEGKSRRIHVIYEIDKHHKAVAGARLHDYIVLKGKPGGVLDAETSMQWKLDQFMLAAGLMKKVGKTVKVGTLDTDRPQALPLMQLRVIHQPYDFGDGEGTVPTSKPGGVSPFDPDADEDTDEETEDEAPHEDEEDEDEDEEEDEEEDEDEDDGLDDLSIAKLRKLAKEAGLSTKSMTEDDLREKIRAAREEALAGDDEDEDEDIEEEDAEIPYSEWSLAELEAELNERGVKTKLKRFRAMTPAARKKAFIAELEKGDESDPFAEGAEDEG